MLATVLNGVIRFSLQNRLLVAALATSALLYGGWQITQLPIDVFPDLNRPRVVVITEAPGMAPEEIEALITFPLETSLNGATGVQAVRSASGVGISLIYVEFDWGTDIHTDRQIVIERLAVATEQLPDDIRPQLAPISSIMGQIMIVGMLSRADARGDNGNATSWTREEQLASGEIAAPGAAARARTSAMDLRTLADWVVRQQLLTIPGVSQVFVMGGQRKQFQVLIHPDLLLRYGVTLHEVKQAVQESNQNTTGGYLTEQGPNELLVRAIGRVRSARDLEEVVVKHRDGRSILLNQVAKIVEGPQVKRGDSSAYVRASGSGSADLGDPTRKAERGTESSIPNGDAWRGGDAVVLTINKQPTADTRQVTQKIGEMLGRLEERLPADVEIVTDLYQQKAFIDLAIENVTEALRDGGILVVIILFLFLLNLRTTFITLTAIPLSIVVTGLVFKAFGLSINTMTLGGLAVAIGELVDDAIVDVENIFRRLRENRLREHPQSPLLVVFRASVEIRNSIVFGTMIVVLVFIPLFALSGMEGRLFTPLGVAYIVSILSSLVVSLTITPILSFWLLSQRRPWYWILAASSPLITLAFSMLFLDERLQTWSFPSTWPDFVKDTFDPRFFGHGVIAVLTAPLLWGAILALDLVLGRVAGQSQDGFVLRVLKSAVGRIIRVSTILPLPILSVAVIAVVIAGWAVVQLESDFLPPFDEGAVQINVLMPPGTSLQKSTEVAGVVDQRLQEIPEIHALVRKTGRAELDEHAEGVHVSEIIASIDAGSERSREELLEDIREKLAEVPGIVVSVEQPLAHLISHMLSGVKAQVAIKLYGDDLDILRGTAQQMEDAIADLPGIEDLQVEQQVSIPQLRIEIDGHALQQYGLTRGNVTEFIETSMQGKVVSSVLEGQRTFDLLVRFDQPFREDLEGLKRLTIHLSDGGTTRLGSVARIYRGIGPNTVNREQVRRRIVIQCNVGERGLVDVVEDIKGRLAPIEQKLPTGYFVEYGGQFQSQQSASRMIALLFVISLLGMVLVLFTMFRSVNLALQVMVALPMAFIGSVAALYITGQTLTIAAMVGFISLCGIASRNGILLINHYLHLVKFEGETWTRDMIVRAGRERLAPVLMTALTSGIGLVPLALAAGEPGKEILYPVATVIIGGLFSSTLLEFLVRPALFWRFGIGAAQRVTELEEDQVQLVEEQLPISMQPRTAAFK